MCLRPVKIKNPVKYKTSYASELGQRVVVPSCSYCHLPIWFNKWSNRKINLNHSCSSYSFNLRLYGSIICKCLQRYNE